MGERKYYLQTKLTEEEEKILKEKCKLMSRNTYIKLVCLHEPKTIKNIYVQSKKEKKEKVGKKRLIICKVSEEEYNQVLASAEKLGFQFIDDYVYFMALYSELKITVDANNLKKKCSNNKEED
ncbi:MAG: hypothetical protein N4A40_13325 [Tissierellales bacterium]|jgi:hypothetical protein|nr:hypothetical protein [Tissierellales bacterium]